MSLPLFYYLAITAIYILMSWALYIPYKMGQLHFTAVANMAVSAYFSALVALNWGWPFWLILPAGTALGALTGWLISRAIGDAPCFSVVIVGFTLIYLTKTVIENTPLLGGPLGLFNIPKVLPRSADNRLLLLLIAGGAVILTALFLHRLDRSRLGRAAATIFVDRDLASSCGISVKRTGQILQTLSSALGGLSGVLYTFIIRSLSPNHFTFNIVGICMTVLFIGGYTTPWGVLLAAPILWGFPLILPESVQSWKLVIYGALLILILLLRPEGFITRPLLAGVTEKIRRTTLRFTKSRG